MCVRQELLDLLLHVTTERLQQNTNKGSVRGGFLLTLRVLLRRQDMILYQHRVRRDEQTERVCAVFASLIPIRRDKHNSPVRTWSHTAPTPRHARTHVPTPARARAPTHARTLEDDHRSFCWDF